MSAIRLTEWSKRLSYVLRHKPDSIGVNLDEAGWVSVDRLLRGLAENGLALSTEDLLEVVRTSPKQRFELSADESEICARQGHSVQVELGYAVAVPPDLLFHGTAESRLVSIMATGLNRGQRHHVHLSTDRSLMLEVGRRHGKPVVLQVDARAMRAEGYEFFVTENAVWLTDHVPPQFLKAMD